MIHGKVWVFNTSSMACKLEDGHVHVLGNLLEVESQVIPVT